MRDTHTLVQRPLGHMLLYRLNECTFDPSSSLAGAEANRVGNGSSCLVLRIMLTCPESRSRALRLMALLSGTFHSAKTVSCFAAIAVRVVAYSLS